MVGHNAQQFVVVNEVGHMLMGQYKYYIYSKYTGSFGDG